MSYLLIIVIINIDWTGQSFEKKENENKICENFHVKIVFVEKRTNVTCKCM
jgi:hypothetical protein